MTNVLLTRRSLLALPVAVAIGSPASAAEPLVTVELFTSQGCSSCPPADALLAEIGQMPGVVALAWHVDYWDYLGWKDTLGSAAFSQRQYDYAKARGDMDVYTPQVIVNGTAHVVGSNRDDILQAIAAERRKAADVPLAISQQGAEFQIDIGAGAAVPEATLWVMGIAKTQRVNILKGENSGREITYWHTVRSAMPAGMWSGSAARLRLPKDGLMTAGTDACVALLQHGMVGPVLGAAKWDGARP